MRKYLKNQTRQVYNKLKNDGAINTKESDNFDCKVGDFFFSHSIPWTLHAANDKIRYIRMDGFE